MACDLSVLVQFDPLAVDKCLTRPDKRTLKKEQSSSYIKHGDWDLDALPLHEGIPIVYNTVHDIFSRGIDYRDTPQYTAMVEKVSRGQMTWWCKTHQDIDDYFNKLYHLYEEIRSGRYKSQAELLADQNAYFDPREKNGKLRDEIQLYIGRTGELIFNGTGGAHRLIMSRLSGAELVPGIIMGVHEKWIEDTSSEELRGSNLEEAIKRKIFRSWRRLEV